MFIVSEIYVEDWSLHGLFSTREKAEAYVALVAEAEAAAGIAKDECTDLKIEELAVDELTDVRPVFTATAMLNSSVVSHRITYLPKDAPLPEDRFFLTKEGGAKPYGAESCGFTPIEATANLHAALGKI